jgi:thiamine biosynthesis lipoprotein
MPAETTLEPLDGAARGSAWRGRFKAMASLCELLVDGADEPLARALLGRAAAEAQRIEAKFSRYRDDSVIAQMQRSRGQLLTVDDETALLLDYAAACHAMSDGLFDVTSGVLRGAWRFDGSDRVPPAAQVAALTSRVGWHKLRWQRPQLELPEGMEIDLGGIGKEYAVDRALALLQAEAALPMLVNFGGDLAVSGPRVDGSAWQVGIEQPDAGRQSAALLLDLSAGALATSGDARRFLLKDGVRYGHILDPRDGWPVRGAPRSVTVAALRCVEAGTLATLAMLQGPRAEEWLARQGVPHWVVR